MKNFRMPLRFYSWCSTRGAHGNLAQLTGITQTALGNMLNQKSMPTMANLEKYVMHLKLQSHNFFQMMKTDWI